MLKVYAISDKAKDIRLRVQTLNAARLQQSELGEEEDSGEEDQANAPSKPSADHSTVQPAPNWASYLEDDGSGDTGRDPEVYTSRRLVDQDRYITTLDQASRGLGQGARKRNISTAEGDTCHASLQETHNRQAPSHHHNTLPQQKRHQKQYSQPINHQHTLLPCKVDLNTARAASSIRSVSLIPVQPATAVRQTALLVGSASHPPWEGSIHAWNAAPQARQSDATQDPHHFSSSSQQPQRHSCASQQHSFLDQQHSLQPQQQQPCMQTSNARNLHTDTRPRSFQHTDSQQTNDQQHSSHSSQAGPHPGSWQDFEPSNTCPNTSLSHSGHGNQQNACQQAPQFEPARMTVGKAKTASSSVWDSFNEDDETDDGTAARGDGGLAEDQSCQGGFAGGRLMTSFL